MLVQGTAVSNFIYHKDLFNKRLAHGVATQTILILANRRRDNIGAVRDVASYGLESKCSP